VHRSRRRRNAPIDHGFDDGEYEVALVAARGDIEKRELVRALAAQVREHGAQVREVQAGLPVDDPLGDRLADARRHHEAVAAESCAEVESAALRHLINERVPIWGDCVQGGEPARALALLRGRDYALPQDVLDMAFDVLRHRLVLSYEALSDNVTGDDLLEQILQRIPLPVVPLHEHASLSFNS